MRSPLKWAGGKAKLMEEIKSVLPSPLDCQRLIEPFVGGANVFLGTDYKEYVLGDVNKDLIDLYRSIWRFPEYLISLVQELWKEESEEEFKAIRYAFNNMSTSLLKSAIFVYLNRHAFNGLCRYNNKGEFNAHWGNYTNPYLPVDEIKVMSQKLNRCEVDLQWAEFDCTMRKARPGDAVLCDPPYVPLSATSSFTSYAKGGFDMPEQGLLADLAEEMSGNGVHVVVHNHDTDVTRGLYKGASYIKEIDVQRNISCKGDGRGKAKELIAVYLPK